MWWLILRDILTWLKDVQIDGKVLFLDVSVRVSLEEISIWMGSLSRDHSHECGQESLNPQRAPVELEGKSRANLLSA